MTRIAAFLRDWPHALAVLGILLPTALAVAAAVRGAPPRPMTGVPELPSLVFDQYVVDLGAVPPSEEVYARFVFRNTGPNPLKIRELKPSCGCLQPKLSRDTYQPGEVGTFALKVQTASQEPGPKDYTVAVRYDAPQPQERTVTFRVDLPKNQVLVRPRALVFYQSGSSEATSQELVVTDLRAKPLRVLGVRTSSDFVTAEALPEPTTEDGAVRYHVRVTVQGKIPPGRHQALVSIFTDDAEFTELRVPLWVFGPGGEIARRTVGVMR